MLPSTRAGFGAIRCYFYNCCALPSDAFSIVFFVRRIGRSQAKKIAHWMPESLCSADIVPWSGPIHGPVRIESAPARPRSCGTNSHRFSADHAVQYAPGPLSRSQCPWRIWTSSSSRPLEEVSDHRASEVLFAILDLSGSLTKS